MLLHVLLQRKISQMDQNVFPTPLVDQSLLFEVDNEALKRLWKCSNDASWQLFWLIFPFVPDISFHSFVSVLND